MLDEDLGKLYGVPTKRLNEQVRRNQNRFPTDFMFSLSEQEVMALRSHFATSKKTRGGRRTPPMVFTEHGIAMLSSVLKSDRAVQVNITIIRTFVRLRKVLRLDSEFENRIVALESQFDRKFKLVFDAIREMISGHSIPRKRIIGLQNQNK